MQIENANIRYLGILKFLFLNTILYVHLNGLLKLQFRKIFEKELLK